MAQPGLFDLDNRLKSLSQPGDPLESLNETIPWDSFRPALSKALKKFRKSNAGRKPFDSILMFKIFVLQSLYNLSADQTEYQIKDRLSFTRFPGLRIENTIPDARTLWAFRDTLSRKDAIKATVHVSQDFVSLPDSDNTGKQVWADSAYRSEQSDQELKRLNLNNQIHHKGYRGRPLSETQRRVNKKRSRVRARVEHFFGYQQNSLGEKRIRTVGIARAKARIGMMNLADNMKRYVFLQRLSLSRSVT